MTSDRNRAHDPDPKFGMEGCDVPDEMPPFGTRWTCPECGRIWSYQEVDADEGWTANWFVVEVPGD